MYEDAPGRFPDEADVSDEGLAPAPVAWGSAPALLALAAVLLIAASFLG
ncbi:MAG: hypothetical protein H6738_05160 [Alphaproteobacteria bacterium]|nr:hypothetical protein [Alphaproteobacteria bacterium]MCB9696155.1 hypothetical protein [Alphaproteobacteria bacterium]